jgi:hypothetical protein
MKKNVRHRVLAGALLASALLLPPPAPGQTSTTLRRGPDPKPAEAAAGRNESRRPPAPPAGEHGAVILAQPKAAAPSERQAAPSTTQAESSQSTAQAESLQQCDWTLLLVNEVGAYNLFSSGVPCLGCRISNDLTHSVPGTIAFSHSPTGPWSQTLTVYTNLNFSGNGQSETFYIKGFVVGDTTLTAHNSWGPDFVIDFRVMECACPEITATP